mmetsp:Transcript_18038/g.28295  ORF Transcript_18038/g.28295 Transcript_18038/m.28295 type:complete len:471 (+) Transcript_18038:35-1447(+)
MFTLLALLLTCQTAAALSSSSLPPQAAKMNDPNDLKPILSHALQGIISYEYIGDNVKQANAEGSRILSRHSSSLSETDGDDCDADTILETELFLKRVAAKAYTHKSWTDMRRTLVYARTEVRFYNEIVPLLLASNDDILRRQIPKCHHATYDLSGLIDEDSPTTDASQSSPLPENEEQKNALLETKGGHMLLESLSPSHGYYQDSPITRQQSLACLQAVAELHASAWGDNELLKQINDRLSSAGGSYHLQFRNPKELQNMVESWDTFRGNFLGLNEKTKILEKESVVRLGQRVYDMAEYVSKELTPKWDDEYATLVHGDYKAMNVFLPSNDGSDDKLPVMIDFSCAGIGYGISDVGMHICHANLAEDLENGGEEELLEGYLTALEEAVSRRKGESWKYPRDVAMRHYQLACIDYLRFILGRFWRSATPESFEKKKASKNTTLINRNVDAAMVFIEKVDKYLEVYEKKIKS